MPIDIYTTFFIEQKYGFNTASPKIFVLDKLKGLLLGLVIGIPILYLIILLYYKFGTNFWWLAWLVISILSFTISFFYSIIIVPLFNKQTPLQSGELKDALKRLAQQTGFNLENVFILDGSKRSTRANAYFTGFGTKKRIVLYDTLVNQHSTAEIISVVAHEIGHYKKKHTVKGLFIAIANIGLMLFLFSLLVDNPYLYLAVGTPKSFHIGVIIFGILYSPVSFILSIVTNCISRKFEFAADHYASEKSSSEALISALKLLTSNNLSDLVPHPWYVYAYYSHPPLIQRIRTIKQKVDKGSGTL